jgi:sugar lactone lactonase YvrE
MTAAIAHADEVVKLRILPPIYLDDQGGGLKHPEGIACGGESLLAVADTGNGRLLTFSVSGDSVTPVRAIRLRELPYPLQVQFTPAGDIVALDGKLRRLARLAPSGGFSGYVEVAGDTAARPMMLRSFRIDASGAFYLLDIANARVLVLSPEGQVQRQIALPEGEGSYADLAVDARGAVFVLESVGKRVYIASRDDELFAPLTGSMENDLAFPTSMTVDDLGRLFILDEYGGGIVILGPDGSFRGRQSKMGWDAGSLRYPSGLCIDPAGTLYVADRSNNRIQVFAVTVTD